MAAQLTIANQIHTALAEHLKRKVSTIKPTQSLREDLGLDSLAMIELLFRIEEVFDLEVPDADLPKLVTVGDVIRYVETRVKPAPVPRSRRRPA